MVENIKKEIIEYSNKYKSNSVEHYDFWNEHIKYVYNESVKLAGLYNADKTIVELGALLHDIALIKQVGERKDHHINGGILAREILEKHNCSKDIVERVVKCVLNHRSSKNATSIEELCVADADILAHFDNILMLIDLSYNKYKIGLNDIRDWIKEYFEKDYNDLSDKTKESFKEKYKIISEVVLGSREN